MLFRNSSRIVFAYVKLSIKFIYTFFTRRAIFWRLPRRKFTFLRGFLVFILIFSWIFSAWPQIYNFPPKIHEAQAAVSFIGSCENSGISGTDVTLTLPATEVGDLVIVSYAVGDNDSVDFDMTVTSPVSTFTEVADVHAPTDTQDGELGVYWDNDF